jgi:hypothetical protein
MVLNNYSGAMKYRTEGSHSRRQRNPQVVQKGRPARLLLKKAEVEVKVEQ